MIELPRGYKLKEKKINDGKVYHEVQVTLNTPKNYRYLTRKDVEYINLHCIKTEDCLIIKKGVRGHVYVTAFDVQKKKINVEKFIDAITERFTRAVRKWKQGECNDVEV